MSSPAPRVVIIGAGIGGLTLALLLRRRGVIAEIFEQAPELREVGAAVALAANGTRVLQHLDLGDDLARASSEFTEIIHRDGRDGTRIAARALGRQYREAFGAPLFGLHRIALKQLLAGAWGAGHLHLGCRAETLQEHRSGMRVRCASGASFDADLVVGADGMHSQVRRWTSRATPRPPDSAAWCRSSGCHGCPTPAPCSSGWQTPSRAPTWRRSPAGTRPSAR
jgi:salicylate hydroxylase